MLKNFLLSCLALLLVTASDPFHGIQLTAIAPSRINTQLIEYKWKTTDAFDKYLYDEDERVSKLFRLSPYYYPSVKFWFLIYTQFESTKVLVHDKKNLDIIYKIYDFSRIHKAQPNQSIHYGLQQHLTHKKIQTIKETLEQMGKDPFSIEPGPKEMYQILKNAGVQIPANRIKRSAYFYSLRDNIRSQTGQKDFIRSGVIRSLPYQKFLTTYFKEKKLPKELLAVPFLESSFNPIAHSRVNALGVWQFMPLIASYYMPKRKVVDYRSNIGVSSIAAAFLMAENKQIMKTWDLAVTAYNSGTKHLLKKKRSMASRDIDLEDIIKNSDSEHFGFASKNFYSEFLALIYTLAYREELFDSIHRHDRSDVKKNLRFFVAKCQINLNKHLNNKHLGDVTFHNQQVVDKEKVYPRGLILTAKSTLPKNMFFELNLKQLHTKPKDWEKFLKNQSCSTR